MTKILAGAHEGNARYMDMVEFSSPRLTNPFTAWLAANNKLTPAELISLKKSTFEEKLVDVMTYTTKGLVETHDIAKQCGDPLMRERRVESEEQRVVILHKRKESLEGVGITM